MLDDVLSLVLDSAIDVSGAERGFIMLASADSELEFKMARGRGRMTLSGSSFATSRKIPEEVFRTGRAARSLPICSTASSPTSTWARSRSASATCSACRCGWCVIWTRPKPPTSENADWRAVSRQPREGHAPLEFDRGALETLATEAAVAIENARLYRETMEKAKMEQEMRIAAEIQQALLPKAGRAGAFFSAAAASLPCRSIGGDFYDYVDLPDGAFGFALGDVAGKGPPAALLSAMMQGIFAAQAAVERLAVADDHAASTSRSTGAASSRGSSR